MLPTFPEEHLDSMTPAELFDLLGAIAAKLAELSALQSRVVARLFKEREK